mmetsp:Transcript_13198/g.43964  ORF Transcript_13198/g.43964 Transcript_13198/m.43964 type:complete len:293 (-) Transcript_13198:1889-2767(-)
MPGRSAVGRLSDAVDVGRADLRPQRGRSNLFAAQSGDNALPQIAVRRCGGGGLDEGVYVVTHGVAGFESGQNQAAHRGCLLALGPRRARIRIRAGGAARPRRRRLRLDQVAIELLHFVRPALLCPTSARRVCGRCRGAHEAVLGELSLRSRQLFAQIRNLAARAGERGAQRSLGRRLVIQEPNGIGEQLVGQLDVPPQPQLLPVGAKDEAPPIGPHADVNLLLFSVVLVREQEPTVLARHPRRPQHGGEPTAAPVLVLPPHAHDSSVQVCRRAVQDDILGIKGSRPEVLGPV